MLKLGVKRFSVVFLTLEAAREKELEKRMQSTMLKYIITSTILQYTIPSTRIQYTTSRTRLQYLQLRYNIYISENMPYIYVPHHLPYPVVLWLRRRWRHLVCHPAGRWRHRRRPWRLWSRWRRTSELTETGPDPGHCAVNGEKRDDYYQYSIKTTFLIQFFSKTKRGGKTL